jgi:pimeloyl-ACP methyl ester carboxylesterase
VRQWCSEALARADFPLTSCGRALDAILAAMDADGVVLVGNALGAAVALAANSPRIAARALVSPAGFIRLTVDAKLALAKHSATKSAQHSGASSPRPPSPHALEPRSQ